VQRGDAIRRKRPTDWMSYRPSLDKEEVKRSFVRHVQSSLGRDEYSASAWDRFFALCLTVRDELIVRWINTQQTYHQSDARRVYYLSMEYLMGRALHNALVNLKLLEPFRAALTDLGYTLEELEEREADAGLGNGGLGRLAACFLDSMATMELPAYGYGLHYDFGIFRQEIQGGQQVEEPDDWLALPSPWEIPRPDYNVRVRFGGRVQVEADDTGKLRCHWVDTHDVLATAYDTPVPGYGNNTVNTLRLWRAKATEDFDLEDFNVGDYIGSVEHKVLAENITKVLYPNDNVYSGKELRLRQQYFLVSATLQDTIRRHFSSHSTLDNFAERVVFQLNDTHPALAIPELMRLLLDEYGYEWDQAWDITSNCMAYTNHTLLPEALEKWPADLMRQLLPRHVQIINEINHRFLTYVRAKFPGDSDLACRVSIYDEGDGQRIRMAHLAVVGAFSVNGVAAIHTELLKDRVLHDFYRIWPEKLNNKTNGVTPRRWLLSCNPKLAELITSRIGDAWITKLDQLQRLREFVDDDSFIEEFAAVKFAAKERLARYLRDRHGEFFDPHSLFDIHIKRMHEYKRQLLNCLHIIHLYLELRRNPDALKNPRTFFFGGKAAPGYTKAKLIIRLINAVAKRVNSDPKISERLRVFFVPDYNVSRAEILFPAADLSQQISTAGFEASGTGNMKFALNGALTLGTLDGANVEIAEEVGADNIFIFGHTVEQIERLRLEGYNPRRFFEQDWRIAEIFELLSGDFFSPESPGLYQPLVNSLLSSDYYMLLADFDLYRRAQLQVDSAYSDRRKWMQMAIHNVSAVGRFSSDRTIADYVREIWKVRSYPVDLQ
jgi:starch phosphorylase